MRRDVQADQAAGLRSKYVQRGVRVISLLDTQSSFAPRLAHALQAHSQKVLLVDSIGRHAQASKTQFIFGWQQQVARQGLQTISVDGLDVLSAPGVQAGDRAIVQAGAAYDFVLFDGHMLQAEIAIESRTPQTLILALSARPDALANAYALVKTLHENKLDWRVIFMGDPTLGKRMMAATANFMPTQSGWLELAEMEADEHLRALAARISAAEWGASRFYSNTRGECAQHG